MADFEVRGAEDFLRLSKALKNAGRTGLRKELNASLKTATKPLIAETKAAARAQLPSRGGLADRIARKPQTVQVRTGAKTAGVRIVVGGRGGAARTSNQGFIRHPVFGRRVFVRQSVTPGWFDKTLESGAPSVRPLLAQALEDIADKVVREAK